MSCKIPAEVQNYINLVKSNNPRCCQEQHALVSYIEKVFSEEELFVDENQLRHYFSLSKYFPFKKLFAWQEFLIALWDCTYKQDGTPRWKTLFAMLGRGAGKDGIIGFDAFASVSPYNPVGHYDVDICANNEEQATMRRRRRCALLILPDKLATGQSSEALTLSGFGIQIPMTG